MPYGTRECALWDEGEPYSRGECSYPQAGKKGKRLFGNDPTVFQTCVLGLPCQVNKFDSNRLLPTVWDCTQSNKSNIIMINPDVCSKVLP